MPSPAFRRVLLIAVALLTLAGVARAAIDPVLQAQLGNPSGATAVASATTNYLIARPQYSLGYNNATRQPNWVSWDLTVADTGSSGRSSNFFQDTTLPAGFYQVLTTDYSGSGFDRGHMCPSGDRTVTAADNEVTFFMSNMIPQSPDNNQGVWANFEGECRTLAAAGNEVLITSGPSGFSGTTIASGVAVAGYTWKIAVVVPNGPGTALSRVTATTRVIAIKIPNIAGVRSAPWQNYITTAAQLETDTGYRFFTELSASVATALRVKADGATTVPGAPAITTQPAAQTAPVGGAATFTVAATGDATLTYQWSRDDAELPGATASTLALTGVTAASVGSYTVTVKNSLGAVTSAAAPLVVTGLPPVIITAPAARTVAAGATATFAVVVSGSPTLAYQWRRAGLALAGNASATTATLVLANPQAADAALYDVVVSNSSGAATSAAALLTVTPAAPTLAPVAAAQTSAPGATATLTVVASGTAPFTYQWRRAGVPITGNASATTATLTLPAAQAADSATYDVVVTNALGAVTSPGIALAITVVPPAPVLWDFVAADPKTGLPADVTGGTVAQRNNNGTTATITIVSASSGYTGASGTSNAGASARVGPLNLAEGGSAFFEFTLTPAAGRQLAVSGLSLGARSTGTGPQAYALFAVNGADSPPALIASGPLANNSVWTLVTPAFLPVVSAPAAPVTFRLYGYGGAGNAAASTANWRIDDLSVNLATGTGLALGDPAAQRLANLSSRVRISGDVAIAGFVIAGTAPKPVLIRAAGPALGALGVAGTLPAPKLDLYRGAAVIATNIGWTTAANSPAIAAAAASAGAFAFAPGSADSAILTTLAPGAYTAFIGAGAGAGGVGLIEIYDLSAASSGQNLLNLSTRAIAGTGADTLISGLVIGGTLPKRVLIRAAGPALAQFGLAGLLARPQLTLFSGATPVLQNAGWTTSPDAPALSAAAASAGAFAFASGGADAALLVTLAPGAYTAQVTGVTETTGLALLEVYELP